MPALCAPNLAFGLRNVTNKINSDLKIQFFLFVSRLLCSAANVRKVLRVDGPAVVSDQPVLRRALREDLCRLVHHRSQVRSEKLFR